MSDLLRPGQVVRSESGQPCKVIQFLGGGGQGEVYKITWSGREYALKWYFEQNATRDQRDAIRELIKPKCKPSVHFLWPMDLAEEEGIPGFGYIMPPLSRIERVLNLN